MFLKVELKNFRSFDNIVFDLSEKRGRAKKLVIVYGENGSGKSNLMSAFVLLDELLNTMKYRDRLEKILSSTSELPDEDLKKHLQKQLFSSIRDMKAIINDYRTVESEDNISAQYDFVIGENTGSYYIELGEQEIIHERLEYKLNQRKGVCFDCSSKDIFINPAIVKEKELLKDIKATAKRFWGKHSLFAIISHELDDKSKSFGQDNISDNFYNVLAEFELISSKVSIGNRLWDEIYPPNPVFSNPIEGRIAKQDEKAITIAEDMFSRFFTSIDTKIKNLYYKKTFTEKYIDYELFVERFIAGSYRNIEFARESSGNCQLLKLLCYFITASLGATVVLDEADSGIHDLLFKKIIQEINTNINGQIIMTSHNTMLMESNINKDSIYILSEDQEGKKSVRCISDIEKRTYEGNNIRNKYLNDEYKGLPKIEKIYYQELINHMAEEKQDLQ